MAGKGAKWLSGTYDATIGIGKGQSLKFICDLRFRSGRLEGVGKSDHAGSFNLTGEYESGAPYKVKMTLIEAFGHSIINFTGYHAANNTIAGLWDNGDLWFGYKQLTPEEKRALEQKMHDERLQTLLVMGFEQDACENALAATDNDPQKALDWLIGQGGGGSFPGAPSVSLDPQVISNLMAMGFSEDKVRKALTDSGGNADVAVDKLLTQMDDYY